MLSKKPPLQFIADFEGLHSISEISRSHLKALETLGISIYTQQYIVPCARLANFLPVLPPPIAPNTSFISLIFADTEHFSQETFATRRAYTRNSYVIAFVVWESLQLDARWANILSVFDELWIPSTYSQDIFLRHCDIPVRCIPHPVEVPQGIQAQRARWGFNAQDVVFCFAFNGESATFRKNPFGFLDAFERAFGRHHPRAKCVLKITNLPAQSPLTQALRARIAQIGGQLIEASLSRTAMFELIASCDVLVSLHRGEGFGMFIAEGMALGKACIATGYSGNMMFMNGANSVPIDYQLRPLTEADFYLPNGEPILCSYELGSLWAEPNLDHAAQAMQTLFADAELRAQIGTKAREEMRTHYSLSAIGARMEQRLEEIRAQVDFSALSHHSTRLDVPAHIRKERFYAEHPMPSALSALDRHAINTSRQSAKMEPLAHHSYWQPTDGINFFSEHNDMTSSFAIVSAQMHHSLQARGIPVRSFESFFANPSVSAPSDERYGLNLWMYPEHTLQKHPPAKIAALLGGRYSIAYLVHEVLPLPLEHRQALMYFDEIWTPSKFSADLFAMYTDKPITVIPHPIALQAPPADRAKWGLPAHKLIVMVSFQALSIERRKNAQGAVRAFKRAFADLPEEKRPFLVVKAHELQEFDAQTYQTLQAEVADVGGRLIDEKLSRDEFLQLLNSVDVYLSLHRAEGFGLPMAEAMLLGKIVIATRYSGNLSFMHTENSYLVDYRLIQDEIASGETVTWADPDEAHAARLLRDVYEHPQAAQAVAQSGQQTIQHQLNAQRIGSLMQARLAQIDLARVPAALDFLRAEQTELQAQYAAQAWLHDPLQEMHRWIETSLSAQRLSQRNAVVKRLAPLRFATDLLFYMRNLGKIFSAQAALYKQLTQLLLQMFHRLEQTRQQVQQLTQAPAPAPARLETQAPLLANPPLDLVTDAVWRSLGLDVESPDALLIQSPEQLRILNEAAPASLTRVMLVHCLEQYPPQAVALFLAQALESLRADGQLVVVGYNPSYRYLAEIGYAHGLQAIPPAFIAQQTGASAPQLLYLSPHPSAQGNIAWQDYARYLLIVRKEV